MGWKVLCPLNRLSCQSPSSADSCNDAGLGETIVFAWHREEDRTAGSRKRARVAGFMTDLGQNTSAKKLWRDVLGEEVAC